VRAAALLALALLVAGCKPESAGSAAPRPAQGGGAPAGEWPTYHGGFTLDGVAPVAPPDAPVRLWRFAAGDRIEFAPVSSGGRVFFTTSKGALHALDLAGKPLWKAAVDKDSYASPVLASGGLVLAGTSGGLLVAYDAADGKEKWRYEVGGLVQGSPNRADLPDGKRAVIALSQGDGSVHAVELETGKPLWKGSPIDRCDGSAGVSEGRIVLGSCASALHVLTVEKGEKAPDVSLGGDNQVAGGVALSGKVAFAASRSGKFVAVDTAAGKILWTNEDAKKESFGTPAVNDRMALFASDDGKVYALDRGTGKTLWSADTGESPASPVIAGNRAVVAAGGSLLLFDLAQGRLVWTAKVADELTSPAVVGGLILVGADDGTVSAYGRK
jgi:outer membrane protein assembly factor BamB